MIRGLVVVYELFAACIQQIASVYHVIRTYVYYDLLYVPGIIRAGPAPIQGISSTTHRSKIHLGDRKLESLAVPVTYTYFICVISYIYSVVVVACIIRTLYSLVYPDGCILSSGE